MAQSGIIRADIGNKSRMSTMNDRITLELVRDYHGSDGTLGTLHVPGIRGVFQTCERPWKDNEVGDSCVPAGAYPLDFRASGVVARITQGRYKRGWEVSEVPGRTYIMVHPGNTMEDSEGCVLVGLVRFRYNGLPAVGQSQQAFTQFMDAVDPRAQGGYQIVIRDAEGAD